MNDIFGVVDWRRPVDCDRLECLLRPDGAGESPQRYFSPCGTAALAARRIPGPSRVAGMASSRDGRLVVVADSRLDERAELYAQLRGGEVPLERDAADAELILAAFARWGERCPEQLYGDFAFAVWDTRERRLFVARDAMGIRQLCYSPREQGLVFATSADALLRLPETSRDLDGYALSDHLTRNTRFEDRTFYAAIQNVIPGHRLIVSDGGTVAARYWRPSDVDAATGDERELVEQFAKLLNRCVDDRLSDLRSSAAVLTSGGLDSTSVLALAQRSFDSGRVQARPVMVTLYLGRNADADERVYTLPLAERAGTEYVSVQMDRFPMIDGANPDRPAAESPELACEPLRNHWIERSAAAGCEAVLTGHGGDVLFSQGPLTLRDLSPVLAGGPGLQWLLSGSGRRWSMRRLAGLTRRAVPDTLVRQWRWATRSGLYRAVPRWLHPLLVRDAEPMRRSLGPQYARRYTHPARQHQYERLIGRSGQRRLVTQFARAARRSGMDARFPLLDRRLAEFMLRLPFHLLHRPGSGKSKWALREAMRGVLPEEVRSRPKYSGDWEFLLRMELQENLPGLRTSLEQSRLSQLQLTDERKLLRELDSVAGLDLPRGCVLVDGILLEIWLQQRAGCNARVVFSDLDVWQEEQENEIRE